MTTCPLRYFFAPSTPSPSHRPRVTKRGITFLTKSYSEYLDQCRIEFAKQRERHPLDVRIAAVFEVVVERPRTTKLTDPHGDTDNFIKGPMDALEKSEVIVNDKQIVPFAATRRFANPGEEPGAHVWIGEIGDRT